MPVLQSRRLFLERGLMAAGGASFAGGIGLLGLRRTLAAEAPPEINKVRLAKVNGICIAPQYLVEDMLRKEGFSEVEYVEMISGIENAKNMAAGKVDFSLNFVAPLLVAMDAGAPLTVLAGIHPGCFELFGNDRVRTITDLKGKSVGVNSLGSSQHVFLVSMASYVGLDAVNDINWIASPSVLPMELFAEGKIDAFLGFPPEPQEVRARNLGHVIVNSARDRPWSQYFCCVLSANADFVKINPIATKRVVRSILLATDVCVAQPERAARRLVDGKFTRRYDYALQALREVPYGKWRDYDPEDSVRFYTLRLREAGMIKSSPQQIIDNGTDWRFLQEVRREMKI